MQKIMNPGCQKFYPALAPTLLSCCRKDACARACYCAVSQTVHPPLVLPQLWPHCVVALFLLGHVIPKNRFFMPC